MIHHSPLPDVEIPDLPLTEYVLAGGVGQPGKPALIDGASGRVMTYGELDDAIRSLAGGAVTTINPAYTQAEVHHQLADSGARILVTVAPLAAMAVRACEGTAVTEVYLLGETSEADGTMAVRALSALAGRRWPRMS